MLKILQAILDLATKMKVGGGLGSGKDQNVACTVLVFEQKFAFEGAIGSHT